MIAETAVQTDNEIVLIHRAQQGDRDAFGDLVFLHRQGVINVVYRMCGNLHVAEDAAQNAFIKAWKNIPNYKPQASFRSWLYRIAINAALDILRREKPVVDIDLVQVSHHPKIETRIEKQEKVDLVKQALLGLPETSRTVLILREYEGLSYKEISETLNIPLGTVMSRLNYARKSLTNVLKPCLEDA